jgi:hypothetical protein
MILINLVGAYFVMVRINDLFGLGIVIAVSSVLLKKGYSDPQTAFMERGAFNQQKAAEAQTKTTLSNLGLTDTFYRTRQDLNLQAIEDIKSAQDKLANIRQQTLFQEQQKTQFEIDYLKAEQQKAQTQLPLLQRIIDVGKGYETYSPRVRGIFMRKRNGYDPVDYGAIERGKQAQTASESLQSFIKNLDSRISNLKSSFQALTSI